MTPEEGAPVSAVALIVIVVVAVLLVAMLLAGLRRSAVARTKAAGTGVDFDLEPSRSHAEASREQDQVS
jgi:hypothetical protein